MVIIISNTSNNGVISIVSSKTHITKETYLITRMIALDLDVLLEKSKISIRAYHLTSITMILKTHLNELYLNELSSFYFNFFTKTT
jgi:hypothetical protein